MILTTLPDLPPTPETDANAPFRKRFYARWGRENAIVCGRARKAEYAKMTQCFSVKMAWHGSERYRLAHRDVSVDDDSYLVLNEGSHYGSVLAGERPVWTCAVFMRPGLPGEVRAARRLSVERALDGAVAGPAPATFSEHLRRHDALVSPLLRRLFGAAFAGERDEDWLEQQLLVLMQALCVSADVDAAAIGRLRRTRASTRAELARRLRLAADYIASCHAEPIGLDDMARVACLSRFHFLRQFTVLHGMTPHDFLLARRAATARRLAAPGRYALADIAVRAGFGSVASLRRALAKTAGGGPETSNFCNPAAAAAT